MTTQAFQTNPELTAIAIGYKNRDVDLIADLVMPRVHKGAKKFSFTKYTAADAYTIPNTRVGRKSDPTMVDFGGTLVHDECVDWGLDDLVPNDEQEAWEKAPKVAGAVSPLSKSTSLLTSLIQLDREVRVAGMVFNAANYIAGQQTTLSGTSQWSDYTNSNPVTAILGGLDTMLIRANSLTFGQQTWTQFRQHPKVVQAVFGSANTSGVVTREHIKELFEIKNIFVGAGFVNTARKGQAAAYGRVWGKHCSAQFISEDQADADQPTFGFTAGFGDKIAGTMPSSKGLRGGQIIRVGESVKEVIAAQECGYFWQNAVA